MNPTRSQNNTDTTFRSCADTTGCALNGAAQKPQNWNPSGFSRPQLGQIATTATLKDRTRRRGNDGGAHLRTVTAKVSEARAPVRSPRVRP